MPTHHNNLYLLLYQPVPTNFAWTNTTTIVVLRVLFNLYIAHCTTPFCACQHTITFSISCFINPCPPFGQPTVLFAPVLLINSCQTIFCASTPVLVPQFNALGTAHCSLQIRKNVEVFVWVVFFLVLILEMSCHFHTLLSVIKCENVNWMQSRCNVTIIQATRQTPLFINTPDYSSSTICKSNQFYNSVNASMVALVAKISKEEQCIDQSWGLSSANEKPPPKEMAWLHPFLVELKGWGRAHSIVFRFGLGISIFPPSLPPIWSSAW